MRSMRRLPGRARAARPLDLPPRHPRQQRPLRRAPRHGHRRHRRVPPARRRGAEQGRDGQRHDRHRRGARRDRRRALRRSARGRRLQPHSEEDRRGRDRRAGARQARRRLRRGARTSRRAASEARTCGRAHRGFVGVCANRFGCRKAARRERPRAGSRAHRRHQRHADGRRRPRASRHHDGLGDVHRAAEPEGGAPQDGHVGRGGGLSRGGHHHARRGLPLRRRSGRCPRARRPPARQRCRRTPT